jgi:hypothetical protein
MLRALVASTLVLSAFSATLSAQDVDAKIAPLQQAAEAAKAQQTAGEPAVQVARAKAKELQAARPRALPERRPSA